MRALPGHPPGQQGQHRVGLDDVALDVGQSASVGLVQHVAAYERLAATAARTADRDAARLALMANPLVREYRLADGMLERLLADVLGPAPTRVGAAR